MAMVCALHAALLPAIACAEGRKHPRKPARMHALVAHDATRRGCTIDDALASQTTAATPTSLAPADAAVTAEAVRTLPTVAFAPARDAGTTMPVVAHATDYATAATALAPMPQRRSAPLRFFDRDSLRAQLQSIRRLPLVNLFDNDQLSIYLGIDRKGVAGLHLQQHRPDEYVALDDVPDRDVPSTTDAPPRSPTLDVR